MSLIKTPSEIQLMTESGRILGEALKAVAAAVKPGVSLLELDMIAHDTIVRNGGESAFLNYRPEGASHPYPATLCTSVNDVIVHGVPDVRVLNEGDIISIDLGVRYKKYYSDAAISLPVGAISDAAKKLLSVTREALSRGIAVAVESNTLGDIGHAIQEYVEENGFHIVKGLTGHGIGTKLHEDPWVANEGKPGAGKPLQAGMCLALEPMVAIGTNRIKQLEDESYGTADGSLAAHFEHTIVITEKGNRILTA